MAHLLWIQLCRDLPQCLEERPSQGFEDSILRGLVFGRLKRTFLYSQFLQLLLLPLPPFHPHLLPLSLARKCPQFHSPLLLVSSLRRYCDFVVLASVTLLPWRARTVNIFQLPAFLLFPFPIPPFLYSPHSHSHIPFTLPQLNTQMDR